MTVPVMVVDPVPHATLHCRFDGHAAPPDELPPPPDELLLLLPPKCVPLPDPLDAPLLPPLLAPLLLAPPEEEKPGPPLLLPPQAGARRSAAVDAKVAQLTASVRRFMTRVSPSEVQATERGAGVPMAAHPGVCGGSSKECLRLALPLPRARKVPSAGPM
jgi:hypothetical protein